ARLLTLEPYQPDVLGRDDVSEQGERLRVGGRAIPQRRQNLLVGPSHRPNHPLDVCLHCIPPPPASLSSTVVVMPKVVLTVFTMPNTGASLDIQTFASDLTSISATLAKVVTARQVHR